MVTCIDFIKSKVVWVKFISSTFCNSKQKMQREFLVSDTLVYMYSMPCLFTRIYVQQIS